MRSFRFLLICAITWYILEFNAEKYKKCPSLYLYALAESKCFADHSGFAEFQCVRLSDITNDKSDANTPVWAQLGAKADCKAPFTRCQCFVDGDEFFYDQYCKCFIPEGPPKFPSTGLIRWKGTIKTNILIYGDTKEAVMGEVHKNNNGHYMKLEWTVGKKSDAKFEILIPDTKGMFTKLVGSGKECSVYERQSGKTLSSIWGKYHDDQTVERKSYDGDTQVWTKFEYASYWDQRWEWTIKYDKQKNYAIPIAYYYHEYVSDDATGGKTVKIRFDYTYAPTGDKESFDWYEYCPDAEKWR